MHTPLFSAALFSIYSPETEWFMKKLGELLIEQGKLSECDVERALLATSKLGNLVGQAPIKRGLISSECVAVALSQKLDTSLLGSVNLPQEPIHLADFSQGFLSSNNFVPVALTDAGIAFSAPLPQDNLLVEALARALDIIVLKAFGLQSNINRALQNHVTREDDQEDLLNGDLSGQRDADSIEHLQTPVSEVSVKRCSPAAVVVLLCSYNGGRFLAQQLESIAEQEDVEVVLHVSDDGSQDETQGILQAFRKRWSEQMLSVVQGPRRGHVDNFFSLIFSKIEGDYFAYADQDDIWDPDKLSRATSALSRLPDDRPAIYCSRSRLIDVHGNDIGLSPLFARPPCFANALIQNIGGGNTMVMNRKARSLLSAVGPVDVVTHDWWSYILVTGSGGTVIYDEHPSVRYRQHQNNLVGSPLSLRDRSERYWSALNGRNQIWNAKNIAALKGVRSYLTEENRRILDEFDAARGEPLLRRLLNLWRSGVYAQSTLGNIELIAAVCLKKL